MHEVIEEAFVSESWDDAKAYQQREERARDLESQGYECTRLNLYRVIDGLPVFVLQTERGESSEILSRQSIRKRIPSRRDSSSQPRRVAQFEAR